MPVNPIDLQVLFTKASDHAENIARSATVNENIKHSDIEKIHQQNLIADEYVKETEEFEEEESTINENGKGEREKKENKNPHKKINQVENNINNNQKKPLLEEGKGRFIDIID